jgi:hypothetical protein
MCHSVTKKVSLSARECEKERTHLKLRSRNHVFLLVLNVVSVYGQMAGCLLLRLNRVGTNRQVSAVCGVGDLGEHNPGRWGHGNEKKSQVNGARCSVVQVLGGNDEAECRTETLDGVDDARNERGFIEVVCKCTGQPVNICRDPRN